ncbi:MAG: OmpA family protein [Pseudomonadota bacterium]
MSQVNKKLFAMMAPLSLAAAVAVTPLSASAAEYLSDSQGEVVVNNYDECWEVSYGLPTCHELNFVFSGTGLFDFDKATIRPDLAAQLDDVAKQAMGMNYNRIDVTAHTDNWGSDAYNQDLSERRAASTVDYLVGLGADPSKISSNGMGESQPVATNETDEGRQLNRRVEIHVE